MERERELEVREREGVRPRAGERTGEARSGEEELGGAARVHDVVCHGGSRRGHAAVSPASARAPGAARRGVPRRGVAG